LLAEEEVHTLQHTEALFAGGRDLDHSQRISIPPDHVGEGTPDIHPNCHQLASPPMPISLDHTPNPNAMKFTVGRPVGGPKTFVAGKPADDPLADDLLTIEGITSIFMSADFVTLSKAPEVDWEEILPQARAILEAWVE
jgi:hypothetical protein